MDLPAERSTAADFQQPVKVITVKRKWVQSTLFPNSKRRIISEDENRKIDEVGEASLKCCSDNKSTKKNSKRNLSKPKANSRASKQIAVNGNEMPKESVDGCFPDTEKADITPKKKFEEEHKCISPENERSCMSRISPIGTRSRQREKQRTKEEASPKDKAIRNLPIAALFKKTPHELVVDEPKLLVIPDLRSEAKLTAEENSRLFAGRPLHPFFSSCKAIKRNQEMIELDSITQCPLESREWIIPQRTIHVLQVVEGDAAESLDWGQWEFSEGIFPSIRSGLGSNCSSLFERSVSSLQIDDFTTCSCPIDTNTCENEDKEIYGSGTGSTQTILSCMSSAEEFQRKFLPKSSCTQIENSLWTDKYQPRYASQICGNRESVKFISEWLCYWHAKNCHSSFENEKSASADDDNSYEDLSGSDSESCDDETSVKNVLLVTGPVGSGKSATIYACAQEQGFQVIEVNASDWRGGALVKQRFGEALESHRHKNKEANTAISKKSPLKSLFGITAAAKVFEDEVEMVKSFNEENSQVCGTPNAYSTEKENKDLNNRSEIKTLILFEDVDATLGEDHGFLSTIQQLALTAKRPMILTSNENGSVLPKNLEKLAVHFEIPSAKELHGLGRVVCEAENANIQPGLIDRFVEYFRGDIRKTILHLQFWCQGRSLMKDCASGITYSPLLFDLNAGHHILPKLIPLSFPSPLSEYVENEISKSLIRFEKQHDFISCEIKTGSVMDGNEFNHLQTKKKAMLSLNGFYNEDESLSRLEYISECSETYSSPVAFAKRDRRRNIRAIMSSDSEEEGQENVVIASPEPSISIETLCGLSTDQNCLNEEQKSFKRCRTSVLDDCDSADLSCVPESVFIPGAENGDESMLFPATVSYKPFCFAEADSINSLFPNIVSVHNENNQELLEGIDDHVETMLPEELVSPPYIENEDNATREYSMFDECSRCDFARVYKVEETWKKLLEFPEELRQHVTLEYKDSLQAMKLLFKMTNLISETDLLHNDLYVSSRWSDEAMGSYRWHDDHVEMSSVVSEHGLCAYSKEAFEFVAKSNGFSCDFGVNLGMEMLSSSTNPMAFGKLLCLDKVKMENPYTMAELISNIEQRKTQSSIRSICKSVVSPRTYLALEGDAFYEYFSALNQISRFESFRLARPVFEKKRRRYVPFFM